MTELKPCPCGKTPTLLHYYGDDVGPKWATMYPNCCGDWMFEFRASYQDPGDQEFKDAAIAAWNDLPRNTE